MNPVELPRSGRGLASLRNADHKMHPIEYIPLHLAHLDRGGWVRLESGNSDTLIFSNVFGSIIRDFHMKSINFFQNEQISLYRTLK